MAAASRAPALSVAALIALGLALRLFPLLGDPLHQDEALYGYWGRLISTGRDPWLTTVPVDKPPLAPYLIAGGQAAFGVSEFTLRLPGLAASLLSIVLIFSLARRLYGGRLTGLVAAAVMALSPYPLLFGATAFTDSILVAWWLAACWAASSGRWGWAGLLLGLAFASKQQAVVLAPLVVLLGLNRWHTCSASRLSRESPAQHTCPAATCPASYAALGERCRGAVRRWGSGAGHLVGGCRWALGGQATDGNWRVASGKFVLGLIFVVVLVFAWDAIRVAQGAAAGFWGQGVDSYGGLRLIWSTELEPRLHGWARLAGYLLAWPWLGRFFLLAVGVLLWNDLTRQRRMQAALVDLALGTFALFYFFVHWLVAFPVWDRYLLPLVPVAGLLLGRMATLVREAARIGNGRWGPALHVSRLGFFALLAVLLVGGGLMATGGRIPVGGDHGAYDGFVQVVDFMRALPVGAVVYDRWLTWHYDFYLFDAYLYRAGFPSPDWLAFDAAMFYDGRPRYLVVPSWESSARVERALAEVGLAMSSVLTTYRRDDTPSFVVYEIGLPLDERG